ncbi:hypothetical protein F7Q99_09995 [Streptomyces kaniharaensis]|uniref:Uncharacterized protein n=1 Tax=Streptomyces kaniharaensis TaxID=212423 RepID=A0A6N7KPX7_9ACTN|nr:hypothetical protein [Streptomyces kaniharaensis]MQS12609.1 hypothetical protein [Streptomyces kaniharaensis]
MSSGDNTGERNPFAPPPADAPEQPWQPRTPAPHPGEGADHPDGDGAGEHPQGQPHPWGPGHDGRQPHPPAPQPPRLDPTDPVQRKARNAAFAGLFALVSMLAGFPLVALFVGALGILWGITAMRAPKPSASGPVGFVPAASSPITPAALSGVLTGAMTVMLASSVIGFGLYYQDYVTCVRDSLTSVGADNCSRLAPPWYVDLVGNDD